MRALYSIHLIMRMPYAAQICSGSNAASRHSTAAELTLLSMPASRRWPVQGAERRGLELRGLEPHKPGGVPRDHVCQSCQVKSECFRGHVV